MHVHAVSSLLSSFFSKNVNNNSATPAASGASSSSGASDIEDAIQDADTAVQAFQKYMQESPGQRMVDAWLKAHNLTQQELNAMPPEKREAIEKEIADDIKKQMTDKTNSQLDSKGGILV